MMNAAEIKVIKAAVKNGAVKADPADRRALAVARYLEGLHNKLSQSSTWRASDVLRPNQTAMTALRKIMDAKGLKPFDSSTPIGAAYQILKQIDLNATRFGYQTVLDKLKLAAYSLKKLQ